LTLKNWHWMLHKEQNSVWYKVIVARYVMDGWRVREGGRLGTTWWNQLLTVRPGLGGLTIIWCGWWVMRPKCVLARMFDWREGRCDRFKKLFDLVKNKDVFVAEIDVCFRLEFKWRRLEVAT
jgi:hypothetical protein